MELTGAKQFSSTTLIGSDSSRRSVDKTNLTHAGCEHFQEVLEKTFFVSIRDSACQLPLTLLATMSSKNRMQDGMR